MQANEKQRFAEMVTATIELYGRGVTDSALQLWWATLERYDFEVVRAALQQHIDESKKAPTPADVTERLRSSDGRPGAEAAWGIALAAADESETVIWTPEIAEAWAAADPIYREGDEVGARMAFKEVYERAVREARAQGFPVRWQVSLGHDPNRRQEVIAGAVDDGRIGRDQATAMLGHDPSGAPDAAPRLEHEGDDDDSDGDSSPVSAEQAKENLRYLRELIQGVGGAEADAIEIDDEQRERTAAWGERRAKEG